MRKQKSVVTLALTLCLAWPALARVEEYGPRRYTQVGHGGHYEHHAIDRSRGSGWAGAIAGGILGAVAGLALSHSAPPVVLAPPVVGTVVPVLPGGCVLTPSYYGPPLYNCANVYYQPFYEGGAYMYEVVPVP